jgi:enamine deaminase RidA (YjgF/YER057c/UK114 family)
VHTRPINPDGLFAGAPYDYAAVVPGGGLVFTAGACPLNPAGHVVAPGDIEAQTQQVLDNLEIVLREAGSELAHVVKTTVFVASADRADLVRAWNVVAERFAASRPPSTLVGVAVLGYPDQLVEIEAVALVPR